MRRLPSAVAALFFLVFPWDAEVVFWMCNSPTTLSMSVVLATFHLTITWARGRQGLWLTPVCAALAFAAACLNEHPAVLLGVIPLIAFAAATDRTRRAFLRAMIPAAAAGVALAVYSVLHARHAPYAMDIGGAHGVLPVERWPEAAWVMIRWAIHYMRSSDWMGRAWEHAGMAFAGAPVLAAVTVIAAIAAGAAWVRSMALRGHETRSPGTPVARSASLALIGLALVVLAAVPIVVFAYWLVPRVLYPAAAGFAVLIAAVFTFVAERERRPLEAMVRTRAIVATIASIVFLGLAAAMVGVQHGFQVRDREDRAALRELRSLMPDPAPGSMFVPARVELPEGPPSARRFEEYYWNAFSSWWSATPSVQLEYKRRDVSCAAARFEMSAWSAPDGKGVIVETYGKKPWSKVVPFELDARGRVHLITHVRFGQSTIEVPQTAPLAARGFIPARTFTFTTPPG